MRPGQYAAWGANTISLQVPDLWVASKKLTGDPSQRLSDVQASVGARSLGPSDRVRIVGAPMPGFDYRYELRRGDEVVATGHLAREPALEVGDRLLIGGLQGIVRTIEPVLGERELHLVVQLLREDVDA